MMKEKTHYGLGTAVSMIVGISIGSGIFFKADEILIATGGNVGLGILVFIIGALCVIFGSITLSQLASLSSMRGGVVSYYEEFVSPRAANAFGWFQLFIYFPTITAIVSWVSGIYTLILFDLPNTLELQVLLGFFYMTFFFGMNYLSYKFGGRFQNITTVLKMIPLIGIGLAGVFWTQSAPSLPEGVSLVQSSDVGWAWLGALVPVAFSFDGWIVSTTITQEVRRHRRTMPIALTVGPLIVLAVYLAFFLGLIAIVGVEFILSAGDQAIAQAGQSLFGIYGERILLSFVLISIMGVVNGISLGYIRLPYTLAAKNMMPMSSKISVRNEEKGLSPYAALTAYGLTVFWLIIHYITQRWDILAGGDISEIAIVFSYVLYIILYIKVLQLGRKKVINNWFLGAFAPIMGTVGSLTILLGGWFSNPVYMPVFILFSALVCVFGYLYAIRNGNKLGHE
ncbi:Permease of the drug/metabolite transporter (DMT) superfamily [Alkalibacterium sp. AK22]|uniref:APC family permease n=1 Tax=Alkalibacterium sp. AK22 TaxID=1229520 RepID=UPI000447F6BE|nr:APC family permease [Alkalibacterium sp. AK22]EXJ23218.1 Permease of the drug/metabolite transporter (DMT) superfamily [Alkalibacterium sp. AK22]